ncbi:hypothetical protein QBC43DRAFT_299219 [Cladorrhinum sp. PSN259]|nr:hypothetical protein QBC43DRAFT_299219 [Cladorrhinum sp. PSN259]
MSTRPSETNLSFGVEIELLFYFLVKPGIFQQESLSSGTADSLSSDHGSRIKRDPTFDLGEEEESRLQAAFPHEADATDLLGSPDLYSNVSEWACRRVQEALLSVPSIQAKPIMQRTGQLSWGPGAPLGPSVLVFNENDGWMVSTDSSVNDRFTPTPTLPEGYEWRNQALEITSPALWDNDQAYEHVLEVLRTLVGRPDFYLRINMTTGFHVHVGAGPGSHHRSTLERAAALAWAADGYMCHAHPAERGYIRYCPSIRETSMLAWNTNGQFDVTKDVKLPQRPRDSNRWLPKHLSRAYPDEPFPSLRPDSLEGPARVRFSEGRNHLRHGVRTKLREAAKFKEKSRQMSISRGVHYLIMDFPSKTDTPDRLHCEYDAPRSSLRSNYNFRQYESVESIYNGNSHYSENLAAFCTPAQISAQIKDELSTKKTIEFREAAGSLNPDWIAAWASICVGYFRAAKYAPDQQFWAIIHKLVDGEKEKGKYDMIDFVMDLGLPGPARYLETALRGVGATDFWYPCRPLTEWY